MSENIPEKIPEHIPEPAPEQSPLQGSDPVSESSAPPPPDSIPNPPAIAAANEPASQPARQSVIQSFFIAVAGWIVPGLGHLVQRRFGRALAGFAAVGTLAVLGLWMRGTVFPPSRDDAFGLLGFIADAGAGIFYLLAHTIEKAGPDVSRAAGDYGTRLLATAGVLNLLFVVDAVEICRGHKN